MTLLPAINGAPLAVSVFEPAGERRGDAVLVHGFTGSKEDFTVLGGMLAERGFRVAAFDNRGQHESPHSADEAAYLIPALAADAAAVARFAGFEHPHLLGHSFGGLVAQRAAVDDPSFWASVTLLCSGPGANPGRRDYDAIIEEMESLTMAESWAGERAEWARAQPDHELLERRWLASDPRSVAAHARQLRSEPSIVAELAATGLPTHVAYGATDDAWPHELQNAMARDLGAVLTIIPDAGHCPNTENPAVTADVLAGFWAAV